MYAIYVYVDLKTNTWLFRVGKRSSSIDYHSFVYKVDNPVQSSLLSSLVLTLIQDFFL